MRVFLGMILGVVLTLGVAYIHDSRTTATLAPGQITAQQNMVNWDVVSSNWHAVRVKMRDAWTGLSDRMSG